MKTSALQEIEKRVESLSHEEQLWLIERLAQRLRQNVTVLPRDMSHDLDEMAADPDIQRELRVIEREFSVAEADGLEGV